MTRKDQARIVRELCNGTRDAIVTKIQGGKIPPEWDGHELREMVFEISRANRSHIIATPGNVRAKTYRNTTLVNNL